MKYNGIWLKEAFSLSLCEEKVAELLKSIRNRDLPLQNTFFNLSTWDYPETNDHFQFLSSEYWKVKANLPSILSGIPDMLV